MTIEKAKQILTAHESIHADAAFKIRRSRLQQRGRRLVDLTEFVVQRHGLLLFQHGEEELPS